MTARQIDDMSVTERNLYWPKLLAICWGERIRTSDWLIQNQLPYRLATPQWDVNEVYRSGSN